MDPEADCGRNALAVAAPTLSERGRAAGGPAGAGEGVEPAGGIRRGGWGACGDRASESGSYCAAQPSSELPDPPTVEGNHFLPRYFLILLAGL